MKKRGICLAGAALTVALLTIGMTKVGKTYVLQASQQTASIFALRYATGKALSRKLPCLPGLPNMHIKPTD